MKRSRSVLNCLDDLFYHDSLAEEGFYSSIEDYNDECSCIGLFIDGDDDEKVKKWRFYSLLFLYSFFSQIEPPNKLMKNSFDDMISLPKILLPSNKSISEEEDNDEKFSFLSSLNDCVEEPITPSTSNDCSSERISQQRTPAFPSSKTLVNRTSGVEDITCHFLQLFANQSSFVL
jgi:hypothetical protein